MKKILLFLVSVFIIVNAQAQYNPAIWQVLDETTNVPAITGLNPSNGYVRDDMAKSKHENANNAYVITWEGDVLKVNFTNPVGSNWADFEFSTIQWVGGTQKMFTKTTDGISQISDVAKGYTVNFSNPSNRIITFKAQADLPMNIRIDLIDINGKISNGASPKYNIPATAGGVNTNDNSKWVTYSFSWGGDATASANVSNATDMYSGVWWDVNNYGLKDAENPLDLSKIVAFAITIDDGEQGLDAEIKNIYIKDVTLGTGTPIQYVEQPSLKVSKSSMTLPGYQNSTDVFDIQSSLDWNIVTNDNWLHVDKNSGTGNSPITITAEQNDGAYRTGSLTISANGISNKIITIKQYPLNTELSVSSNNLTLSHLANSTQTIQVTSLHTSWNATTSDSWLTVSPNTNSLDGITNLIITAQKNTANTNRSSQVTITDEFGISKVITVTQQFDVLLNVEPWTVDNGTTNVQSIKGLTQLPYNTDNSNTYTFSTINDILKIDFINNNSPLNWSDFNFELVNWDGNTGNKFIKDTLGNVQNYDKALGYSVNFTQESNRKVTLKCQSTKALELRADIKDINGKVSNAYSQRVDINQTLNGVNIDDNTKWQDITFSWDVSSMNDYPIADFYSKTWWGVINQNNYTTTELDISKIIGVNFIIDDAAQGILGDSKTLYCKDIQVGSAANPLIYSQPNLLNTSTSQILIEGEQNSIATFQIKSNIAWTISSNQPWVTLSKNSGTGDDIITITANASNSNSFRNALIIVTGNGVTNKFISVTQESINASINLSTINDTISNLNGSTKKITITNVNTSWNAVSNQSWLTLSKVLQNSDAITELTYTVQQNFSSVPRIATITISGIGVPQQTITVTQLATAAYLNITPYTSLKFVPVFNEKVTNEITVNSNTNWTVTSDSPWLTVEMAVGSLNKTLLLIADEFLKRNENRTAKITFTAPGLTPITYEVSQKSIDRFVTTTQGYLYGRIGQEFQNITHLTLYGTMDARDFYWLKLNCNYLVELNLNNVHIVEFTGKVSTDSDITTYNENVLPTGAFYLWSAQYYQTIILPQNITKIDGRAFFHCSYLNNLKMPPTLKELGDYAFASVGALDTLMLPEGFETIGADVFNNTFGANYMNTIYLPSTLKFVGNSAFSGATFLNNIYSASVNPIIIPTNAFSNDQKMNATLYVPFNTKAKYESTSGWSGFQKIVEQGYFSVPETAKTIPGVSNYKVQINVESDVSWTAYSNDGWMQLSTDTSSNGTINLYVTSEQNPFSTPRIGTITVSANGFSINVTITQNSVFIKTVTTTNPGTLNSYFLPQEFTKVSNLTIIGPIDARDFKFLRDSLSSLSILDLSNTNIVAYTGTEGTGGTNSITYEDNTVPQKALFNKISLFNTTLPNSITKIDNEAFKNCYNLQHCTIPQNLEIISDMAFQDCHNLNDTVILPNSVKTIGKMAFYYNFKIEYLQLNQGLETIGASAFRSCINVYGTLSIPSSIVEIDSAVFANMKSIDNLELHEGLKVIGESSFSGCYNLKGTISIPASVTTIKNEAFISLNISKIELSNGIQQIGSRAFAWCTNVQGTLNIPNSVTSIGEFAFGSCKLDTITVDQKTPLNLASSVGVFYNIDKNACKLLVPFRSKYPYKEALQWGEFFNIIEKDGIHVFDTSKTIPNFSHTFELNIAANVPYSVTSNDSWLTVKKDTTFYGSDIIVATVQENTTNTARTTYIVASAFGVDDVTIKITQRPSVAKVVTVSQPGTLMDLLSNEEIQTVSNLTISGTIDARDFKIMRDSIPGLSSIDITNATIVSYTGILGTKGNQNITYPSDEIPKYAFFNRDELYNIDLPLSTKVVGSEAFANCANLNKITIPNGVKYIDSLAYASCLNAKGTLLIPSSVDSIAYSAFIVCSSLDSIHFEEGISIIGTQAFLQSSIKGVLSLPSSLKIVRNNAFQQCYNVTSIVFNNGLEILGDYAFYKCIGLNDTIKFPSSLNRIGTLGFYECSEIPAIIFNENLASIGINAFGFCENLSTIFVKNNTPINLINSGIVFINVNKSTCILHVPYGTKAKYQQANQWKDFLQIIEESHIEINKDSIHISGSQTLVNTIRVTTNVPIKFEPSESWVTVNPINLGDYTNLQLQLTPNTTGITRNATIIISAQGADTIVLQINQSSELLKDITLSENGSLHTILTQTELLELTELKLSGTIDARDFKTMRDSMPELSKIDLLDATIVEYSGTLGTAGGDNTYPANEIPMNAFTAGEKLSSFILPYSTQSVGTLAFAGCKNVLSIQIPPNVTKINNLGFVACTGIIGTLNIPASVKYIGDNAFGLCESIQKVQFSEGLDSIGMLAFSNCISLTELELPKSIRAIRDKSFAGCKNLQSVILQGTNAIIGLNSFVDCKRLQSVQVLEGVTTIEKYAFSNLDSIQTVTFANGIQKIDEYAFGNCKNLQGTIFIPKSVTNIGEMAFINCGKISEVIIEDSCSMIIGPRAFLNCGNITSLSIGYGVSKISDNAFSGCTSIQKLELPITIIEIGTGAFNGCTSISGQLILPQNIQKIGNLAFSSCGNISSIVIPKSVLTIGEFAFAYNYFNLRSIYAKSLTPIDLSLSQNVFANANKTECILYVPSGTKSIYKLANQWKDFLNIVEMDAIIISKNQINIGPSANNTAKVDVETNLVWTVSSNASWLQVNETSITGDKTLIFTTLSAADVNRSGIITLSSPGQTNRLIVVSQLSESKILVNSTAGELENLISNDKKEIVTHLIVTGTIDVRDILFIRDSLPYLEILDLSNATIVEYQGFFDTTLLKSYEIFPPNSIPRSAFKNKITLREIYLPSTIEQIKDDAFSGCDNLQIFKINVADPTNLTISPTALQGINMSTCKLIVPKGSESLYASNNSWKDFEVIEGATEIQLPEIANTQYAISPNPVQESFTIIGLQNEATITIFDIAGKQMLQQKIQPKQQIDCSNLVSGIYIVKVLDAKRIAELQMIKK